MNLSLLILTEGDRSRGLGHVTRCSAYAEGWLTRGGAVHWRLDGDDTARSVAGEVVFTGGGTEANALAIHGLRRGRRVLVGATEHPAVLAAAGPEAETVPVLADGRLDLTALARMLEGGAVARQGDWRLGQAGGDLCADPARIGMP